MTADLVVGCVERCHVWWWLFLLGVVCVCVCVCADRCVVVDVGKGARDEGGRRGHVDSLRNPIPVRTRLRSVV